MYLGFLSPLHYSGMFIKIQLSINIHVYFWNINPIPFNYISILIPTSHSLDYSTLLIKFWNWDVCVYQVCSYFFNTWLFWVPNSTLWILESFCQHLRRIELEFWKGMHRICRSIWWVLSDLLMCDIFHLINSFNSIL